MNKTSFEGIIAEVYKHDFSAFDEPPAHRFSIRHKRKMKKIFALFQKNAGGITRPVRPPAARLALRYFVIVLLALLTLAACALVIERFTEEIFVDHSEIRVHEQGLTDAPETLEEIYRPTYIPTGFALESEELFPNAYDEKNDIFVNLIHKIWYIEEETGEYLSFYQFTKDEYAGRYSTDRFPLEEITVNGFSGLYMDYSSGEHIGGLIVWDNNDYIFEIDGNISKEEVLKIAESIQN